MYGGVIQGTGYSFLGGSSDGKEHQGALWVAAKWLISWYGSDLLGMFSLCKLIKLFTYNMYIFITRVTMQCRIGFPGSPNLWPTILAMLFILQPMTLFYFLHSICHWLKSFSLLFMYVQSSPSPPPLKYSIMWPRSLPALFTIPKYQCLESLVLGISWTEKYM